MKLELLKELKNEFLTYALDTLEADKIADEGNYFGSSHLQREASERLEESVTFLMPTLSNSCYNYLMKKAEFEADNYRFLKIKKNQSDFFEQKINKIMILRATAQKVSNNMKKMSTKMMETLAEKVDRNNYKEYREQEMQAGGYFEQIAYNRNVYGCTAQLFKGTKTGTLVFTTDIYAVSF